jgi:hypothetical protein
VERGRLVRWWIEGARINWELGVARLSGGYLSPVCQTFLNLCREYFSADAGPTDGPEAARRKGPARGGAAKKTSKARGGAKSGAKTRR